jgi:hypothetical protein
VDRYIRSTDGERENEPQRSKWEPIDRGLTERAVRVFTIESD